MQKESKMTYQIRQKLGNYRIVKLLGSGGFAEVYLARHIYLQTQAAIKVLQIQLTTEALQNFLKEARIIASLEHPNIVRVLEFGIENARPYLVMNYAQNGTLRQRYPRGQALAPITVQKLLQQIVAGLDYAHKHKIIHRDIKPENMLLGANNNILLSDFGLALEGHSAYYSQPTDKAGTMLYMAPEQFRGNPCSASDQYSLGIVVYEWLSGALPFVGTGLGVAVQHAQNEPLPLYEQMPGLPIDISNAVMRTLQKDPQERYEQIQDFADAFTEACEKYHELLEDTESTQLFPETRAEEQSTADTIARLSLEENRIDTGRTLSFDPFLEEREQPGSSSVAVPATRVLIYEHSLQEQQTQQIADITTSSRKGRLEKRFTRKQIVLCGLSGLILCLSGFWGIHQQEAKPSEAALSVHVRQAVIAPTLTPMPDKTHRPRVKKTASSTALQASIQEQTGPASQVSTTATQPTNTMINEPGLTPSEVVTPHASPTATPTAIVRATASPSAVGGKVSGRLSVSIGSVPTIVQNGSSVSVQIITNSGNCQVSLQVIYSNASQTFKSQSYMTDSSGNASIDWDVNVNTQSVGKYTLASLIVSATDQSGRTALSLPTIVQVI
jgi:serine/threonine protein kinase